MYNLYEGLIGEVNNNREFDWGIFYDTFYNYTKNFEKNTDTLKYFKSVNYKFNNFGHRCKNVDDINLNNYILFIGGSNAVGVGNYLEDTYPYLLSEKLNMDYYNLSVVGSGIDIHIHNLTVWIQKFKIPKLILWEWTNDARVICNKYNSLSPIGPWDNDNKYVEFLILAEKIGFLKARRQLASEFLKTLNIPIIQIDNFLNAEIIHFEGLDLSRDMQHVGPKSHNQVYQKILNYYLNEVKDKFL